MAREIREYGINVNPEYLFGAIRDYLVNVENYEYIEYENENVFKRGLGMMSGPTFFKFMFSPGVVRMETWMKYSLLPGVYVGEIGTTGFVGAATKGPWKKRIDTIESIIFQNGGIILNGSFGYQNQNYGNPGAYNENMNAFQQNGWQVQQGYYTNTTGALPVNSNISKKEWLKNYASQSVKNDIRNAAIICYVSALITFVLSLVFKNTAEILSAIVFAGITLGAHLTKHKAWAIILCIYTGLNTIIGFVEEGVFLGYLYIIAAVAILISANKLDKAYKAYKNQL